MKKTLLFLAACTVILAACNQRDTATTPTSSFDAIYQFSVLDGDSNIVNLADYQGQVLLVVNTATQCGFTPQYEALQKTYAIYHDRGFEILDFPCNQFGAQAPGSHDEIAAFCSSTYHTTFEQMNKVEVNGDSAAALFVWLKEQAPFAGFDTTDRIGALLDKMYRAEDSLYDQNSDIKWNFTKFLIDRDGKVVRRFEPTVPMDSVAAAVEALL